MTALEEWRLAVILLGALAVKLELAGFEVFPVSQELVHILVACSHPAVSVERHERDELEW